MSRPSLLMVPLLLAIALATEDDEQRLRELRIEMVKIQILSRLRLEEPPTGGAPYDPETSREAVRLLLGSTEDPRTEERLVVPPAREGEACPDRSDCVTFPFELGSSLNGSALDLWVFLEDAPPRTLSVCLALGDDGVEEPRRFELVDTGWNKLRLASALALPIDAFDNDTVNATLHIEGVSSGRRPFLMATVPVRSRPLRDAPPPDCDPSQTCCLRPLRLSFSEIGFHFIVYPEALEANMCSGRCRLDPGALRTHYERALSTSLEKNASLGEALGECWSLCCKPRSLKEVRVIYRDMENLHHDQFIPELSVESCGCS